MTKSIRTLPGRATTLIAICRKCGKKLGGGFGEDGSQSLAKALRRTLGEAKGKRARIRLVETACLDICPKQAVVALRGDAPGSVLIVPQGTDLRDVAGQLGLTAGDGTSPAQQTFGPRLIPVPQ